MANIKFLSGYVSKFEAQKIKSYQLANFKKQGRKDLKIIIEKASDFKIQGQKITGDYIVVAYLKSEFKIEPKVIIETIVKVIKKAKTIKIKVPQPSFIPVKRFINTTVATLKQKWVWKFIKSPLKLAS
ncbi:hypothetical protein [Flavobacterium sp. UBA7682]|uniref:hypothetical protein n=1 Tax=Flavobacterium sp. UBA7682 TaxID=1946560 RepID=UPI0025C0A074|nr:hypothetical protein [Flavobacterium sp. UBA7682]